MSDNSKIEWTDATWNPDLPNSEEVQCEEEAIQGRADHNPFNSGIYSKILVKCYHLN